MSTSSQLVGQTLAHYRILERIGAGGMGVVYRAHDERLDRDVALKVLPPGSLADETARKGFRREALTLSKLSHPNIAHIYDFDTQEGVDFLVMEYVPGKTLADKVSTGALAEKEVLTLATQIAQTLQDSHEQGIVHRDLKPGNIMVSRKGLVKVLDFGLARLLRAGEVSSVETVSKVTEAGGTLPYMAPEQLRGEAPDARSDIYAIGAVVYEMATGQRPFEAKLSTALADDILHKPPAPPGRLNPKLSPKLEDIILKCLEKESDNRYQSARELAVDLRRLTTAASSAMVTAPARTGRSWGWAFAIISAAALTTLIAVLAWNPGALRERLVGGGTPQIRSLAVLPLENLSHDPDQEYFAEGMTEELITDLSKLGALRVISRTSAMHYKGTNKTLPEIARELNVDGVVEGTVMRSGNRVRITAQLIQARTDRHLWAETYERDLGDVLRLQSEVAQSVAAEIRVRISPKERALLASSRAVLPEAHEDYLRGRYYWNRRTEEGLRRGIVYFQEAIAKDPNYAVAYAGLADSYNLLPSYGNVQPTEAFPKAKGAATKALEIDGTLAEAQAALSFTLEYYDWDWQSGEAGFKRAIELNPNYASAHHWYAHHLLAFARFDDAAAELNRALELDPLSLIINTDLAQFFYLARRYDRAIEQCRKTMQMDSTFAKTHTVLGEAYLRKKMYPQAITELQEAAALSPGRGRDMALLAYAHALAGNRAKAERILKRLQQSETTASYNPAVAAIYTVLGDKNQAFKWLQSAVKEHSAWMTFLKSDPMFDSLHSDPRFQDLLGEMGLPH